MSLFTYILLVIVVLLLIESAILWRKLSSKKLQENNLAILQNDLEYARREISRLESRNQAQEEDLRNAREQEITLRETSARIEQEKILVEKKLEETQRTAEGLQERLFKEFHSIADKVLAQKSEEITQRQGQSLRHILDPLQIKIEDFKKKFEDTYLTEAKERHTLTDAVKQLHQESLRLSQEANNLTQALRGQSKVQGDWGETLLVRILEESGLRSPIQYEVQQYIRSESGTLVTHTETGKRMRPDVIVHLPDDRDVIIDSKVSLSAYASLVEEKDPEKIKTLIRSHIQSIRNHFKELSRVDYAKHMSTSPEFVMMFVPVEGAFSLALQHDPELWMDAYRQGILVAGPTNTIAMLKVISDLWVRERQKENVERIVTEATKMYEKFVHFSKEFEKLQTHLNALESTYQKARAQLCSGRGNLVGKLEKIKGLGLSTAKSIAPTLVGDSDLGDIEDEVDSTE